MNIKKVADGYRSQVKNSGVRIWERFFYLFEALREDVCWETDSADALRYTRRFYNDLRKNRASEKELGLLQRCLEELVWYDRMRKCFLKGRRPKNLREEERKTLGTQLRRSLYQLDLFLSELPELTEKILTRAFKESGIRTR